MIDKKNFYTVIGASNNKEKYGYKVFKDLLDAGYKVTPVNPAEKEILGKKVFSTLSEIKENIDVAIFVTQPTITEKILEEVKKLGIKKVWLQPGSQSDIAISFCKNNTIECIHDACIMIQRTK
ncbi:MAG: CoA-binding protein [candidate division SR1 bacterium]|nr:CoA-binding protein [candidate division SR1 bacterium]